MTRTVVIPDIHGCRDSLERLLPQVLDQADRLVFLGDYIDRGPDSRGVVDRILALRREGRFVVTLMGNHEAMFLDYLAGRDPGVFLCNGGRETLASYELDGLPQEEAALALPPDHLAFFHDLLLCWEDEHAYYVHAGLEPGRHLTQQRPAWCLWVRREFLELRHDFGKPVVFGHTRQERPLVEKEKIGLDTGAVYGGPLTALLLPEKRFVSVPGEQRRPWRGPSSY